MPRKLDPGFEATYSKFSDDKFFIVIEGDDPKFDLARTKQLLEQTGASLVEELED